MRIGKTVTTEFAAITIGSSTINPHSPAGTVRTPGGSSSGSGASVGDCQIPVALTTQTGGSTIRPASFNGVYGLKPTWGAVSREGQKFYSLLLDTLGWYGRSVQDLSLLADVFNLHDDEPSTFKSVRGAKIAVCRTDNWRHAGEGTKAALEKAKTLLQAHGAVLEEVALPPSFADIPEWHRVLLATDGRAGFLPEHRVAKDRLHVSLSTYIDLPEFTHKQQLAAQDGIAALRPEFDRIAAGYDAVLTASVVDEAPEGLEFTGDAVFCAMWTVRTDALPVSTVKSQLAVPICPGGVSRLARCRAETCSNTSFVVMLRHRSAVTWREECIIILTCWRLHRHCTSPSSICRAFRARQACLLVCPSSRPASGTDTCLRWPKLWAVFSRLRGDGRGM